MIKRIKLFYWLNFCKKYKGYREVNGQFVYKPGNYTTYMNFKGLNVTITNSPKNETKQ